MTIVSKLNAWKESMLSFPFVAQLIGGRVGKDFLITAGSNFCIAVFSAVGGILAARLLGPTGRGQLASATVWAGILGTVATLGLPQALTYLVARDPDSIGSVLRTVIVIWGVQSTVILLLGWFAVTLLLGRTQPNAVVVVRVYLFSIPCSLLTTYLSTMAQGLKRFELFSVLRVISSFGYVLVLGLAVALGVREAHALVIMMLVFRVIWAPLALFIFFTAIRPEGSYSRALTLQLINYGLKSYWGSLSWMANARLDQFIMSAFVELKSLGYYSVAVSYATVLFPLSGAFAMVLFPRVAEDVGQRALNKIKRTLRLNLAITGSGALLLGALSPLILPGLFGAAYQPAISPAIILLVGTLFLGFNYVLSDGLRGLGYPTATSVAEVAGTLLTVVGLMVAVPRFGILGAAIVSACSYVVVGLVLLTALNKVEKVYSE